MYSVRCLFSALVSVMFVGSALAQEGQPSEAQALAETQEEEDNTSTFGETAVDEDDMADLLNSRQQIQQTVTFTREIDGEVVETVKETITYSEDDPIQSTEAGASIIEQMKEKFDRAALTRNEAFEEAKLDFVVADVNRDKMITADEFVALVAKWRSEDEGGLLADELYEISIGDDGEIVRTTDAETVDVGTFSPAQQKFSFMSGMTDVMSQQDYIREYLTDFDAFDANGDSYLQGEELEGFRKANRGENS